MERLTDIEVIAGQVHPIPKLELQNPSGLQKKAIDRMVRAGQKWPPSSPAELREWCNAVQKPMDGFDMAFYRSALETGVLDADFCREQIEKYRTAKGNVYAGWV